ncbi:hypothetical protein AXF42_Ash021025 [Apostasia shenzhenica]|uniref:Uncharacterized protein n=1 Tax=Apostasia shenzhenica TaxID=1088818 RepID=A0A2I0ADU7_9ASPA|nr:hypothetical protein AXF42_Ash021025 [Apostasia shenzhenica]
MPKTICAILSLTCGSIRVSLVNSCFFFSVRMLILFFLIGISGQPELELGWFRLRQIGNKRVPHDRPGPSRLPAKRRRVVSEDLGEGSSVAPRSLDEGEDDLAYIDEIQVSDDPEDRPEGRRGEIGSDVEASDSAGPSVEEPMEDVRREPPRTVPEGRVDSTTRLGARAVDLVEQLAREAMAQERKAKENELRYLESERQRLESERQRLESERLCLLAEKRLRSAMRGLDESRRRESELQRLLERSLDESGRSREQGVFDFRRSLEFKAFMKGALENSVDMLDSALLDRGLVSREDLEGLDMNECILVGSRSYHCKFFDMSAKEMERMFAFVSDVKAVIPPTEAEMAGVAEKVPVPEENSSPHGEGFSGGILSDPLAVSPLRSRDPLEDVPRTPGADLVVDSDPKSFEDGH